MSNNIRVKNFDDGRAVLYSYNVPVAAFVPGFGYVKVDRRYSVTTTKHANKFCGGKNAGTVVSEAQFNQMLEGVL